MRVNDDVLAVLSAANTTGNELRLVGQLDRKMYVRVNDVLEAAGGKWNKKAKAHIFESDAAERIDEIILSGEVEIPKDEFNYFPSPALVVDRLIEIAQIEQGMSALEPSAGRGAIALACADAGATVDCYELMDANITELLKHHIVKGGKLRRTLQFDFLAVEPCGSYDRVVMNPPFAKQADIKHVLHALQFLKPDGLLVSVMSAGVAFRNNKLTQEFRELIVNRGGFVEELPDGAFKESGTMVRTIIVSIPA